MSDEAMQIDVDSVFESVGRMRTDFLWDGQRTAIEPPDVGDDTATDLLWRFSNLVRILRAEMTEQLERCAQAIVEGAIDAHVADQAPTAADTDVAVGTTVSPTTAAPAAPSQATSANDSSDPVPPTGTSSTTVPGDGTTPTATTSTTTPEAG